MVLRAVLVVALVSAAALSLSARDGLDWERLADPLEVRWARVVVGTVVVLLLAALARAVLRRLRRTRPRPPVGDGRTEPEGEPFPVLLRLVAVVLVLVTLAATWWVIEGFSPDVPQASIVPAPAEDPGPDPALPPGPDWPTLLLVGAVLLAVAVVARLRAARRVTDVHGEGRQAPGTAGADAGELAAAVTAGQVELSGRADARAAILAAYAAMTARIESGLTAGARSGSAADTPTELLSRAAAAGLVDGSADSSSARLTALFREARFSRHPMGEAHRRDAERALATLRDELAVRHG